MVYYIQRGSFFFTIFQMRGVALSLRSLNIFQTYNFPNFNFPKLHFYIQTIFTTQKFHTNQYERENLLKNLYSSRYNFVRPPVRWSSNQVYFHFTSVFTTPMGVFNLSPIMPRDMCLSDRSMINIPNLGIYILIYTIRETRTSRHHDSISSLCKYM